MDYANSPDFPSTWGWLNNDCLFIFGWTHPLSHTAKILWLIYVLKSYWSVLTWCLQTLSLDCRQLSLPLWTQSWPRQIVKNTVLGFFLGTRTISCAPELPYATSRIWGIEISCFSHTHAHTHIHTQTHSHDNPQPHTSHQIRSRHVTGNSSIQSSADGFAPSQLSPRRESPAAGHIASPHYWKSVLQLNAIWENTVMRPGSF